MKAKHLFLAIAVLLLAAGGLWFARAAWRAHRQLVTLDIPNATLGVVLRKIEWQVWEKIRTEESLAGVHVKLQVKDRPLPEVLDRLAEQAGARWNNDERKMRASRPVDTRPGFLGFGGPILNELRTKVDDSVLTWDVSAIQELNPDINVYARVAKGYRAPSIQGRVAFGRELSVADSETTMSYEAGIKTVLLDRKLRFNLTGYFFNTNDLQLSAVGGTNNFTSLLNADKVRGKGVEAELEARPVQGLSLTAGLSYNDTEIDDDQLFVAGCGAPCTVLDPQRPGSPGIFSIDGNSLPQAPKWTFNFTAGYEYPVGPGSIYAFTDWYHRSKINFFLYESVEFSDDQLLEGGLRIGYKTGRYDIAAFARNITNDESAVSGIDFNNLTAMVNEPRIFGIEAGIKF